MKNSRSRILSALATVLLAACAGQSERGTGGMPPQPTGQTLVYECGDFDFVVRTGPGEVALYLPDEYRVLGQVRSGSGAKYEDGDIMFWSRGDSAMLDVGPRHYRDCELNRRRGPWEDARRRGVDFRAVGQEPGWVLEIRHDRDMLMVEHYGSRRVRLPTPEPEPTETGERYDISTETHSMTVEIRLELCRDTMSGEAFHNRVTVELDGQLYRGCGEALDPL